MGLGNYSIEEIEPVDQVRLDVYGIGAHQRAAFIVSAPEVGSCPR